MQAWHIAAGAKIEGLKRTALAQVELRPTQVRVRTQAVTRIGGGTRLLGIYVGSRQMHEDLARFVEAAKLQPVVDRVFPFAELQDAYRYFEAGKHFGKVAIQKNA